MLNEKLSNYIKPRHIQTDLVRKRLTTFAKPDCYWHETIEYVVASKRSLLATKILTEVRAHR